MLPKEREYLVLDNLNLVHSILRKTFHMNPYYQEYDDYFQEGCIGLILAAIRFDESKGFKFSTYAVSMICGSIQRYRRDKGNIIRIPRTKYEMIIDIAKFTSQGFTIKEIEELTGFTSEDIQRTLYTHCVDSLDKTVRIDSNSDIKLYEIIPDKSNDYEELLSQESIWVGISNVTSKLIIEKHRDIWEEWIWSMMYGERLSQMYLAKKYNISQPQIHRLLDKCKKMLAEELSK